MHGRQVTRWVALSLVALLAACASVDIKNKQRPADTVRGDVYRTDHEVQAVFDQKKSKVYSVYLRYLREQPVFSGRIMFSITIEPSGQVSGCSIQQITFDNRALGKAVCSEIQQFNFGQKNASSITILYPIDFIPR